MQIIELKPMKRLGSKFAMPNLDLLVLMQNAPCVVHGQRGFVLYYLANRLDPIEQNIDDCMDKRSE